MIDQKAKVEAVIAWLQFCYAMMEQEKENMIPYNPFYSSPRTPDGILSDDYADRLIATIDAEFVAELKRYPAYHFRNADGAVIPPEFNRLSINGKRALTQGLDMILCKYA